MSITRPTTPGPRPLGAAGATVIIVIILAATVLLVTASPTMPPTARIALLAAASFIGLLTVRLATVGTNRAVTTALGRVLTVTPPQY